MASRSDDFVSRIIPIGPTTVTGADPVPLYPEPDIEFATEPVESAADGGVEPQPVVEIETKILSRATPEPPKAEPSAERPSAEKSIVAQPIVAPKPAVSEPTTVAVVEKTKTSVEPAVTRGWVVRVGTFSVSENASRILQELRAKGFRASSTKINTASGSSATRVWVGPVAERVQAARLRNDIERKTGEKGLITAYP
jgi:DedD protein